MSYTVTSRILSSEERTILFGRGLAKTAIAIKALDADNYLGLFQAIYDGEPISIPGLEDLKGLNRVYIFCDLPTGSRYYSESSRYDSKGRDLVYDLPIVYAKYKINEFLTPFVKEATSMFPDVAPTQDIFNQYARSLGTSYERLHEVFLGGCFLNMFDNKVISLASFDTLLDNAQSIDYHTLMGSTKAFSQADAEAIWYYHSFLLPASVAEPLVSYSPSQLFETNIGNYVRTHKAEFVDAFASLFNWSQGAEVNLVIAPGYFKLNGFHYFNGKHYLGIGWTNNSPMTEEKGHSPMSALTVALEGYLYSENRKTPVALSNLFGFSDGQGRSRYSSNRGSFLLINKAALSSSKPMQAAAIPELFELDKDFFQSIQQIVLDAEAEGIKLTSYEENEKFRKREFAIKRETVHTMSEVENSRYLTIQSSDSKFFVLTKTSKAKEAARKTAITRKISGAVAPVIDFAVRIFASTDMETGFKDPAFSYPFNSQKLFGNTVEALDGITYLADCWAFAEKASTTSYQKANAITAPDVISKIYQTMNYDGHPFGEWTPQGTQTRSYRDTFTNKSQAEHNALIMGYPYGYYLGLVSGAGFTNLFSPSSGMLNLLGVANAIYHSSDLVKFPPELAHLSAHNSYRGTQLTGKQLHHFYVNNFIGDNQELSTAIEARKGDDWVSVPTNQVTASTAFTFSQEAVDSFSALKKSKTFTDYNAWFVNVKPILEGRLKTLLAKDIYAYQFNMFMLRYFGDLLERLATAETPYIPKEEKKPRGRKKKEEAEVAEEVASEVAEAKATSDPILEDKTKVAELLAALSGGLNVKQSQ